MSVNFALWPSLPRSSYSLAEQYGETTIADMIADMIGATNEIEPAGGFRQLDPRVISLWRLNNAIASAVILLLVLGLWLLSSLGLFENLEPDIAVKPLAAVGLVLIVALLAWFTWWRPPRLYSAWGYRIDDRVLETRSGLLIRVTRLLPLARVQHVDLQRGPFERMMGLASLVLYTAGTHSASITVPGLDADEAVRLRDHLVEIGGDDAV